MASSYIGLLEISTHLLNLRNFINTLRPRRDRRHFADDIFKCVLLNENERISLRISLKFVPKGSINNNPALVQIMAWRRSGDKPLSEPMMGSLLTHICVTRPQCLFAPTYNHIFVFSSLMYSQKPRVLTLTGEMWIVACCQFRIYAVCDLCHSGTVRNSGLCATALKRDTYICTWLAIRWLLFKITRCAT